MDFTPDADHAALRSAVGAITAGFGGAYYAAKAEAREPTEELWRKLGDHGFIGINMPLYISGVDEAEAVLVMARTGTDERTGRGRLFLFVVDICAPGLVAQPLPVSVALPERQFTLHFDDVRVPADRLVGDEGRGFGQVFHGLNPERITGAALCVGVGRYALDRAVEYANARTVLGAADRRPPGRGTPAGQGEDRGRAGRVDDRVGRLAARPRPAGR
jgi:alkylation response protein AidB-like acyl-CoA dehydrogenase